MLISSHIAGQVAYLISKRGATKLASSGFEKEFFCVDDFLNAINDWRVGDHMNEKVNKLQCVQYVRQKGFTIYLCEAREPRWNRHDGIVTMDASHTSDTRYERE